jgi:hypothetical protein
VVCPLRLAVGVKTAFFPLSAFSLSLFFSFSLFLFSPSLSLCLSLSLFLSLPTFVSYMGCLGFEVRLLVQDAVVPQAGFLPQWSHQDGKCVGAFRGHTGDCERFLQTCCLTFIFPVSFFILHLIKCWSFGQGMIATSFA